jgi:hypothetical protein
MQFSSVCAHDCFVDVMVTILQILCVFSNFLKKFVSVTHFHVDLRSRFLPLESLDGSIHFPFGKFSQPERKLYVYVTKAECI